MEQLALFEGSHLPRTAAREALSRGNIGEARAQLERMGGAREEAADAARLERILSALVAASETNARDVHDAFASALAGAEPRGFLSDGEWFALYAQRVASALDAEPGKCFRGWLGAHFAFAARDWRARPHGSSRASSGIMQAEAARRAFELGEVEGGEWPTPPAREPCRFRRSAPALERQALALDAPLAPPFPPRSRISTQRARDLPGPGRAGSCPGRLTASPPPEPGRGGQRRMADGGDSHEDEACAFAALRA
jgi:hypothetical protein